MNDAPPPSATSRLLTPLRRVCDLFIPDDDLELSEIGDRRLTIAAETVDAIKARDDAFHDWSLKFLEQAQTAILDSHQHIVTKTLALAGWFGAILGILSTAATLLLSASGVPINPASRMLAKLVIIAALTMFVLSIWGVCRILWRLQLDVDSSDWLTQEEFSKPQALQRERVVELIIRNPRNAVRVGAKGRLYQGAVWAFFAAVALLILAIALLYLGMGQLPPKALCSTHA
jgi:hypothetical protein